MSFTFVTTFLNLPKNLFWFRINALIGCIFSLMSLGTDWIISGIYYTPWHPYPKAGPLHFLLLIHCAYLALWPMKLMLDDFKSPFHTTRRRHQIKYMICAVVVLTFSMWDFLDNYGLQLYPIGCFSTALFLLIVTTAIVKHQLMDIQIVIRKSLVYSLLISIITLLYLLIVFIFENIFHNYIGYRTFTGSLLTASLIALIFIPLKNRLQYYVDKLLFKNTTVEIAHENELLRTEVAKTEKFKAIADLASGIAHEIRNPLTALQTFNEYFPQKKNDPAFLEKYQSIMTKETKRINTMLNELLTFAKPSPPKMETTDPNKILEEIVNLVEQQCLSSNIQVLLDLKDFPLIQADPNQLKQALLNIVLNAIDAMHTGGRLDIVGRPQQSAYTITISDTGHGIDPKDLPHIFEPFYTRKEQGTGLGLSITEGIIEKHGGKIAVKSKINEGTSFTIMLPIPYQDQG